MPANDYSNRFCDDRHKNIDKEFKAVWTRMNGFDKKLWAIIVLIMANLGTVIGILVK